jgi:hypothetical protein
MTQKKKRRSKRDSRRNEKRGGKERMGKGRRSSVVTWL